MEFRIAIHESDQTFSGRWIEYCRLKGLPFDSVNAYRTDILSVLRKYTIFLFHWHNQEPVAIPIGPQILAAAQSMGLMVWPEQHTCRFYNDKIFQKYLLEAAGAPVIPTYIFYDRESALKWIETASFPKVFKLLCGRRSHNVKLITSKNEAIQLCKIAFREGFYKDAMDEGFYYPDHHLWEAMHNQPHAGDTRRRGAVAYSRHLVGRLLRSAGKPSQLWKNLTQREFGYVYFQDFVPNNNFDTRIVVIGDRAFGCVRDNRKGDFRASGGGGADYTMKRVDHRCVKTAFETARNLGVQSLALDFLIDSQKGPLIEELNYNFSSNLVHKCQGYWDTDFNFHEGHFWAQDAILEDLLKRVEQC